MPSYAATYMAARRAKRRADAVVYLGGKCARCGAVETLEFDHIDPATKIANVSEMLDTPLAVLMVEVEKCQLLCDRCHITKTAEDNGWPAHGRSCKCDNCRERRRDYMRRWRAKVQQRSEMV